MHVRLSWCVGGRVGTVRNYCMVFFSVLGFGSSEIFGMGLFMFLFVVVLGISQYFCS